MLKTNQAQTYFLIKSVLSNLYKTAQLFSSKIKFKII